MKTRLDDLLETIHPSRTYDFYRRKIDDAVRTFPFESFSVDKAASCEHFITNFFACVNGSIMDGSFSESAYMAMAMFRIVFQPRYGEYPELPIYERLIHGHEGGMNGFVQEAVDALVEHFAFIPIANRVDEFIESLSDDELSVTAEEYLSKYGQLLPAEITSQGAYRFTPFLTKFLKEHPKLLLKLRSVR